nr:MAG TPA: hypothetical protein [Caudoviricetes sp.]
MKSFRKTKNHSNLCAILQTPKESKFSIYIGVFRSYNKAVPKRLIPFLPTLERMEYRTS